MAGNEQIAESLRSWAGNWDEEAWAADPDLYPPEQTQDAIKLLRKAANQIERVEAERDEAEAAQDILGQQYARTEQEHLKALREAQEALRWALAAAEGRNRLLRKVEKRADDVTAELVALRVSLREEVDWLQREYERAYDQFASTDKPATAGSADGKAQMCLSVIRRLSSLCGVKS